MTAALPFACRVLMQFSSTANAIWAKSGCAARLTGVAVLWPSVLNRLARAAGAGCALSTALACSAAAVLGVATAMVRRSGESSALAAVAVPGLRCGSVLRGRAAVVGRAVGVRAPRFCAAAVLGLAGFAGMASWARSFRSSPLKPGCSSSHCFSAVLTALAAAALRDAPGSRLLESPLVLALPLLLVRAGQHRASNASKQAVAPRSARASTLSAYTSTNACVMSAAHAAAQATITFPTSRQSALPQPAAATAGCVASNAPAASTAGCSTCRADGSVQARTELYKQLATVSGGSWQQLVVVKAPLVAHSEARAMRSASSNNHCKRTASGCISRTRAYVSATRSSMRRCAAGFCSSSKQG